MLPGSGAVEAPTNSTVITTCFPSGVKSPAWKESDIFPMQPVRRGLIDGVQAPVLLSGATGGSGSSTTSIDSDRGGSGIPDRIPRVKMPETARNFQCIWM